METHPKSEFEFLASDRQFLVSKWMQGLAFYLAITTFVIKALAEGEADIIMRMGFLAFVTLLNILSLVNSFVTKARVDEMEERMRHLAYILGFETPTSLTWGHAIATVFILFVEILAAVLVAIRI